MKCRSRVLVLVLVFSNLLFTATVHSNELVIVGNFWEPFTGENLHRKGAASHLVSELLHSKNHKTDIIIMPWARILFMLKNANSEIDGVIGIWRTKEREEYVLFSEPYYENQLCLVKHVDSDFEYSSLDDLTDKLIGVGRNYDYSDEIQNATHFVRAEAVTLGQNLLRLARKRLDLVLTDCIIGQYYLRNLRLEGQVNREIEFVEGVVDSTSLHFGVPKSNPDAQIIIDDFNTALRDFAANGKLQEIYGLWQIPFPN